MLNSEDMLASNASVYSDSMCSILEGAFGQFHGVMGKHSITVLHSAPLVFWDKENTLQPFNKLNFDKERELFLQCFKETCHDIDYSLTMQHRMPF